MSTQERIATLNRELPLTETKSTFTVYDDIDPYGRHWHHTGPFRLFEQERVRIFKERGMDVWEMAEKEELLGFVYEISIRYSGQIAEGDEVEVISRVFQTRRTLLTFHQTIRKQDKNMIEAVVDVALVNKAGRPAGIPQEVLDKLQVNQA